MGFFLFNVIEDVVEAVTDVVGGIVEPILGLGSSSAAKVSQGLTDQQTQASKEIADYQNQANIQMWKMQNAYNDPSAQIERMRKAGLNPLSGSFGGAQALSPNLSASQMQSPNVAQNAQASLGFFSEVANLMSVANDMKLKTAERENIEKQTDKLGSEVSLNQQLLDFNKQYMSGVLSAQNAELVLLGDTHDLNKLQQKNYFKQWNVLSAQLDSYAQSTKESEQRIKSMLASTGLTNKQIDWYDRLQGANLKKINADIDVSYKQVAGYLEHLSHENGVLDANRYLLEDEHFINSFKKRFFPKIQFQEYMSLCEGVKNAQMSNDKLKLDLNYKSDFGKFGYFLEKFGSVASGVTSFGLGMLAKGIGKNVAPVVAPSMIPTNPLAGGSAGSPDSSHWY